MRKLLIFALLVCPSAHACNCAYDALIEARGVTEDARQFRNGHTNSTVEPNSMSGEGAIEIARNSVSYHPENVWGAVLVENMWVVRFCRCGWRGGAGMLLVDPSREQVVKYLGER